MRKSTLFIVLMTLFEVGCALAGNPLPVRSNAWFNQQNFDNYNSGNAAALPYDLTNVAGTVYPVTGTAYPGFTGSNYVFIANVGTTPTTVSDVTNNVLALTSNKTMSFSPNGLPGTFTKYFTSDGTTNGTLKYSNKYFYVKTAFWGGMRGTAYQLRNSNNDVIFEFGGAQNTGVYYTLGNGTLSSATIPTISNTGLAARAQWSDMELLLDLTSGNGKIVYCKFENSNNTTKTYSITPNTALTNSGILKSLNIITGYNYAGAGFDNTTIGELAPDSISTLSVPVSHQTSSGTVTSSLSVSPIVNAFGNTITVDALNDLNITWSITDWGGLSNDDQSKITLTRDASEYSIATLSTNGSISTDATITVTVSCAKKTLTATIPLKGNSIDGVKSNLNTELSNATTLYNGTINTNPYISGLRSALNDVISTGQTLYNSGSVVANDYIIATSNLATAESNLNTGIANYNTYVNYINNTVKVGRDSVASNRYYSSTAFFPAIVSILNNAIATAETAKGTISSTTDISNAQTALSTAYATFNSDRPAYYTLAIQIAAVSSRVTAVNPRTGTKFLDFASVSLSTLTGAKNTAQTTLTTGTVASDLTTAATTLSTALTTFNASTRNTSPGTSYYRIYSYGVSGGDILTDASLKRIIYAADASTLKYKISSAGFDANSIWEITETSSGSGAYTIKNVATGAYINGTTLSSSSVNYTLPDATSQNGLVQFSGDNFCFYNIKNGTTVLRLSTWDDVSKSGVLITESSSVVRARNCFQFEPITTLPTSLNGTTSAASNWSTGSAPVSGDIAVAGALTVDQDLTSLSNIDVVNGGQITVNPGKKLTIGSGVFANSGTFTLSSDAENGTATFVNTDAAAKTIIANVLQYLSSGRNWYVSSPVSGAATTALSSATAVFKYDEPSAQFVQVTGSMEPGKGYVAQTVTSNGTVSFNGILNDGPQSISLTRTTGVVKSGFNLVGNPYPSYLSWDAAYNDATNQSAANIGSTIWYRTKNASGKYVFATYNAVSNLGSTIEAGNVATGNIPPMQAFWVRVNETSSTGLLTFKNSMRTHKGTQMQSDGRTYNDATLRSATILAPSQVLRLEVSNGTNNDEAIILFNGNATNGVDDYDSYKMSNDNEAIPAIYTKVGADNMVINGMNNVESTNEIPLGFTTGQANSFTIKATQVSNFDGVNIYLHDNMLNTELDLTNGGAYTFTSDATTTDTRFSVLFKSASVITGLNNATLTNIHVYGNKDGQIVVSGSGNFGNSDSFELYNCIGKKIETGKLTNSTSVLAESLIPGVYLVVLKVNNEKKTQKVEVSNE